MSILDTFYIVYKNDGIKQALEESKQYDSQIAELAAKGKKRTEEENKQLTDLRKQRRENTQDIKDQTREVDKLTESFTDLATRGIAAATAFASFQAIKSGVMDAAKLNSSLEIQSKITDQNVHELRAWSAAVEASGGSAQGFLATINSMSEAAAQNGVAFTKVGDLFMYYNKQIEGLPKQEQRRILALGGITDPGAIALLMQSNEELQKSIDLHMRLTAATQADYEAARDFERAQAELGQTLTSAYTKLGTDIFPTASGSLREFTQFLKELQQEKGGVEVFFASMITLAAGLTTAIIKLSGITGATTAAGAAIGLAGGIAGTAGAAGAGLAATFGAGAAGEGIGGYLKSKGYYFDYNTGKFGWAEPKTPAANDDQSALDFWMSKGLSRDQAAGPAANEFRESSGKPGARNFQKGTHYGLYQWSEDRRNLIKKGIGVDVATAGIAEQREAAYWEAVTRGDFARVQGTSSPGESAAVFHGSFERSGEHPGERMRIAHQLASQSTLGSQGSSVDRSLSVKIDKIDVHTQATDAAGVSRDLSRALEGQLAELWSDTNDGIDR